VIVALVDDLMDRSRVTAALPDARYARSADDCAEATVVLVDLTRHGGDVAAVRAAAPGAHIVAFGPHVDDGALAAARADGADTVLPRSRFFADVVAATEGAPPGAAPGA
jgi:hypothetical protein